MDVKITSKVHIHTSQPCLRTSSWATSDLIVSSRELREVFWTNLSVLKKIWSFERWGSVLGSHVKKSSDTFGIVGNLDKPFNHPVTVS